MTCSFFILQVLCLLNTISAEGHSKRVDDIYRRKGKRFSERANAFEYDFLFMTEMHRETGH